MILVYHTTGVCKQCNAISMHDINNTDNPITDKKSSYKCNCVGTEGFL